VQINFQFRGALEDVNVTLHKQALLNCGVCGTEVTVDIGDSENETAQTALQEHCHCQLGTQWLYRTLHSRKQLAINQQETTTTLTT
jgi:hypothetical protein